MVVQLSQAQRRGQAAVSEELSVEATGETVGEAKWSALRELERLVPGIDRDSVRFQVVTEGERGLLGVGYAPARVVATADRPEAHSQPEPAEGEPAIVRELLERVLGVLGLEARVDVSEEGDEVVATVSGGDLGVLSEAESSRFGNFEAARSEGTTATETRTATVRFPSA